MQHYEDAMHSHSPQLSQENFARIGMACEIFILFLPFDASKDLENSIIINCIFTG
jgi:hypothetical protein